MARRCIERHNCLHLSDGRYCRMNISEEDEWWFKATGEEDGRYRFRTPSLRNVAETGPYMHHGLFVSPDVVLGLLLQRPPKPEPIAKTRKRQIANGKNVVASGHECLCNRLRSRAPQVRGALLLAGRQNRPRNVQELARHRRR